MSGPIKRQPLVIGLTGPFGAGATTVSKVLEGMQFQRTSLSQAIKSELAEWEAQEQDKWQEQMRAWEEGQKVGPPPPSRSLSPQERRRKLQDLGNEGRKKSPDYWLGKALASVDLGKDVVIDCIRNHREIEALRSRFTNSLVIAVLASKERRWHRIAPDYDGNRKLFDRDDRRDADEEEDTGQHVQKCVDTADYVLLNEEDHRSTTGRAAALRSRLETDIAFVRGQKAREPTPHEAHMATAYTQSHMSLCLKRHVGAMIVGLDGRPISLGYNENPVKIQPCKRDPGYCIKDSIMEDELERLVGVYCPQCGTRNERLSKPYVCCNPQCRENLKLRLYPSRNIEKCTAIHAEEQAINSLQGRSAKDATMYSTTFPCVQCARRIVDVGIKLVVYVEAYPIEEAGALLEKGKVAVEPFQGFKARYFNLIFKQVE
jgi:deoxycytidylate deaminase